MITRQLIVWRGNVVHFFNRKSGNLRGRTNINYSMTMKYEKKRNDTGKGKEASKSMKWKGWENKGGIETRRELTKEPQHNEQEEEQRGGRANQSEGGEPKSRQGEEEGRKEQRKEEASHEAKRISMRPGEARKKGEGRRKEGREREGEGSWRVSERGGHSRISFRANTFSIVAEDDKAAALERDSPRMTRGKMAAFSVELI